MAKFAISLGVYRRSFNETQQHDTPYHAEERTVIYEHYNSTQCTIHEWFIARRLDMRAVSCQQSAGAYSTVSKGTQDPTELTKSPLHLPSYLPETKSDS